MSAPRPIPAAATPQRQHRWIRFDRNELAGSFGDIGTDLPLIIGMVLAADLDPASVFIVFGVMQIATGLMYGLPMPMQPLKAMAVIVITERLTGDVLYAAGFAIGVIMLMLTLTGALSGLARIIPQCVVRGVQLGLGLALASLALRQYVPALGAEGYILAAIGFGVMIALRGNRRFPAGLLVIGLGFAYALVFQFDFSAVAGGMAITLPGHHVPQLDAILTGVIVLALPQLPLSISNSVIATRQTIADLYPDRAVSIDKIGVTYSLVNIIVPFFQGIPLCHGCGGLAGHYAFGARTGGSVVHYGSLFVVIGLLFSNVAEQVVQVFPLPILGIVLLFEALVLMSFLRDQAASLRNLSVALVTAALAFTLPHGFVIGLIAGTVLHYLLQWRARRNCAGAGTRHPRS